MYSFSLSLSLQKSLLDMTSWQSESYTDDTNEENENFDVDLYATLGIQFALYDEASQELNLQQFQFQ